MHLSYMYDRDHIAYMVDLPPRLAVPCSILSGCTFCLKKPFFLELFKKASFFSKPSLPGLSVRGIKSPFELITFIKPQAQGVSSSTWGVVRRELVFQYRD